MAAIVCHGYQSCLESQLVESRIHRLRLLPPKPLAPQPIDLSFKSCFLESNTEYHCEQNSYKSDTKNGGWSSIEALPNVSQSLKEATYVHPQTKDSSLRLSAKSLELCTENLGNETGTEIIESGIDLLSWENYGEGEERKSCQVLKSKKEKTKNFPPPLTTMRGSESLRVRPHREGGRLVIEVTKVPSSASCFQSERSHGRLRLSFWTNPEVEEEEEQQNVELSPTLANNIVITKFIKTGQSFSRELATETELDSRSNLRDEEVEEVVDEKNKENNIGTIEDGMKIMEKYERRSCRCKEGDNENNELLTNNWGQRLWVASS